MRRFMTLAHIKKGRAFWPFKDRSASLTGQIGAMGGGDPPSNTSYFDLLTENRR
jgi:hypothetical protein